MFVRVCVGVCGHVRVGVGVSVCVCVKEKREGKKKTWSFQKKIKF